MAMLSIEVGTLLEAFAAVMWWPALSRRSALTRTRSITHAKPASAPSKSERPSGSCALRRRSLYRHGGAAVPVRSVQWTIRIRIDQHAGRLPLQACGLMSDNLARATQFQCFGRSRRRYQGHRYLSCIVSHRWLLPATRRQPRRPLSKDRTGNCSSTRLPRSHRAFRWVSGATTKLDNDPRRPGCH